MKKLNMSKIALELCVKSADEGRNCPEECPYYKRGHCIQLMHTDVLTYIKRLEEMCGISGKETEK